MKTLFILKKTKKHDLIICSIIFITYIIIGFYHFFIKEITSIELAFRLLIPLSLIAIPKYTGLTYKQFTAPNYTSLFTYNRSVTIVDEIPYVLPVALLFFTKYFIYIGLILGILFEISPEYKKTLCSKKSKTTFFIFKNSFPTKNCKLDSKTHLF